MKALPLTLMVAVVLTGCAQEPQVDMQGRAAALAQVIASEQDHVNVAELSDWIIKDRRDFELVDIREEPDFAAGHIEGARNIPLAGLVSDRALASLSPKRKVVVYSNGTAHAHAAALLLRLVDRDAYSLLGGYNHWQAYLNDPAAAGMAEMDPKGKAQYQAVACYFEGDYVAQAGLVPKDPRPPVPSMPGRTEPAAEADGLGLGLGLGHGSDEVQDGRGGGAASAPADPLGLGLDHGLGGEAAEAVREVAPKPEPGTTRRLLIRAEC